MPVAASAPASVADVPILRAKLARPQSKEIAVNRPELVERLGRNLSRRLTLVSAPAGYGKTTIVAQWIASYEGSVAWLSLDMLDNDLRTFVSYVVAAVRVAYPDAGATVDPLLHGSQTPPVSHLADALIEDLADLSDDLILILDDYHFITDSTIIAFMDRLVEFLPSSVHLVLTTRADPALPIARLRARGELAEVRAADLQFNAFQAQALLTQLTGIPIDLATAQLLDDRTEGWVIALQLAALALPKDETAEAFAGRFAQGNHAFISDYLMDEVLSRQTPVVQEFLLVTSILERLSAGLCQALLPDRPVSQDSLESLWHSNLLIMPQDDQRLWFGYHQLFRDLLRRRLKAKVPAETLCELHRRASVWFAQEGHISEAIGHALAAGDEDAAVRLVEANLHPTMNREQWWRIDQWLTLLPEPLRRRPEMLVAWGWVCVLNLNNTVLAEIIDAVESQLADATLMPVKWADLRPQLDVMKAVVAYWGGNPATAIELAERGHQRLQPDMIYAISMALNMGGLARSSAGTPVEALDYLQVNIEAYGYRSDTLLCRLLLAQCGVEVAIGDMRALRRTAETLMRVGERAGLPNSRTWANYALGLIRYEWNDMSMAQRHLRQVVDSAFSVNNKTVYEAYITLVLALEAEGRRAEADMTLQRMREFLIDSNNLPALVLADAMQLQVAVNRGDDRLVLPSVTDLTPAQARKDLHLSFLVSPVLSRVRYLLFVSSANSLHEAEALLTTMHQAAVSTAMLRRLVEILALQSLVAAAGGDEDRALAYLAQSIALAEPGRMVRTFVECGAGLVPLLERLHVTGATVNYVGRILGAYAAAAAIDAPQLPGPAIDDALVQLSASLTNREQEVLLMLADRLSNKEIAARLYLSPLTVKKYTANIYQKLGVGNRRAAVSLAEHIGLLDALA